MCYGLTSGVDACILIEIIAYNLIMYSLLHKMEPNATSLNKALKDQKFITKMMNEIQKEFPEIILKNTDNIQGVSEGHYQSLNLSGKFMYKIKIFTDIYSTYGLYLKYSDKDDKMIKGTLGDFLTDTLKYSPKIEERYKGLGEANWWEIAETIMNPSTRMLVQLTLDDVDRDLKLIENLHASGKEAQEFRKKLMKEYRISRDEIDN